MFHPEGPTFLELARQALSSTRRGYDLLAPKFDYTPYRTPDRVLDAVAPHLGAPGSVERALDVCCGTGAGLRILRPLCREQAVGVDFSEGMMREAERHAGDWPGDAEIRFVRADVLDMPFESAFDLATCWGANGHILPADEPRFVESVGRALRPAGRFVFLSSEMPPVLSARWLISRGFNAAMHVRNALLDPPFVMFYLTFLLPGAARLLDRNGFDVEVRSGLFPQPYEHGKLVIATKRPRG